VIDHGARADVRELLERCSVVVGCAGANVVAEVAAARRPFVCLPQPRPFDEQLHQAEALRRAGLAEVRERWPADEEWPALLAAAEARDPSRWELLHDGRAASRLAALVSEAAG
jgi:UDP-N-acetylglucosamine:LPS N-acetylglucosamine transferase